MNCKRYISVFLALFILLVNSSASLVLHYCNDQIASVSLIYQKNKIVESAEIHSCCDADEKVEDKNCCSNEEIKVEKKIDYLILKDFKFNFLAVNFNVKNPVFFKEFSILSTKKNIVAYYCNSNAPPFYKLYSQLVFYA